MMKASFIYWHSLGVSLLALAACGGTASAASLTPMPLGGHAMAPVGFTAFCARKPTECAGADVAAPAPVVAAPAEERDLAITTEAPTGWALAFMRARGERDVATGALDSTGSSRPFRAMSRWNADFTSAEPAYRSWGAHAGLERVSTQTRAAAEVETTASRMLPPPSDIEHGQASLKLLKRVNRDINKAIVPATDEQISGSWDRWDEPLADLAGRKGVAYGDCEDYVLEKRRVLIAEGVDPKTLSIAVVRSHGGDIHAVLLAATENGEYVLDNLSYWVLPWQEAPYTWVMRQVDGDAHDWRTIPRLDGSIRTAALSLQ